MVGKENYIIAINTMIDFCNQSDIKDYVIAMYLSGSVARGDFYPGKSDIDLYIVTYDKNQDIEERFLLVVQKVADEMLGDLKNTCNEAITCAFTTLDEIKQGRSWLGCGSEYHSFVNSGKLLYGEDIKEYIVEPNAEQVRTLVKEAMNSLTMMVSKEQLPNKNEINNYMLRGIFGGIFSAAHYVLSYHGVYCRGKEEITSEFSKMFVFNEDLCEVLNKVLYMWNLFGMRNLSVDEALELFKEGLKFITKSNDLIVKGSYRNEYSG